MSKKADMMRQLVSFVEEHNVQEYCTLMDYLSGKGTEQLYSFAVDEVPLVIAYMESRRRCLGLAPEFGSDDFLSV